MAHTLQDIADILQVSPSTVSKAINNRPGVSDELRQRILQTIDEMNFKPRRAVRGVAKDTTVSASLVLRSNDSYRVDPFYSIIAEALAQELQQASINPLLTVLNETPTNPTELDELFSSQGVHGVVVIGAALETEFLEGVKNVGLPVVLVDNYYDGLSSVNTENRQGAQNAVAHLIEMGHTDIACISGPISQGSQLRRLQGYSEALSTAGIPYRDSYVIECEGVGVDDGHQALSSLDTTNVSAIFATTDKLAIGTIKGLHEHGFVPGQDISVIGFDDIEWGLHSMPALTTVHIPKQQLGQLAAQLLRNLIDDANALPVAIQVGTQLVVRDSVTSPR